jgi:hypothetical protein
MSFANDDTANSSCTEIIKLTNLFSCWTVQRSGLAWIASKLRKLGISQDCWGPAWSWYRLIFVGLLVCLWKKVWQMFYLSLICIHAYLLVGHYWVQTLLTLSNMLNLTLIFIHISWSSAGRSYHTKHWLGCFFVNTVGGRLYWLASCWIF